MIKNLIIPTIENKGCGSVEINDEKLLIQYFENPREHFKQQGSYATRFYTESGSFAFEMYSFNITDKTMYPEGRDELVQKAYLNWKKECDNVNLYIQKFGEEKYKRNKLWGYISSTWLYMHIIFFMPSFLVFILTAIIANIGQHDMNKLAHSSIILGASVAALFFCTAIIIYTVISKIGKKYNVNFVE